MAYTELAGRHWNRGTQFAVRTVGVAAKADTDFPQVGDSLPSWTETRLAPICVDVRPDFISWPGQVVYAATWQGMMTQRELNALG